jgi:hypothetical protein
MKDSKLEKRMNNFMKVEFNMIDAREQHNLSLRKRKNEEMLNYKRNTAPRNMIDVGLQIDIDHLDVAPSLKPFEITNIVSNCKLTHIEQRHSQNRQLLCL